MRLLYSGVLWQNTQNTKEVKVPLERNQACCYESCATAMCQSSDWGSVGETASTLDDSQTQGPVTNKIPGAANSTANFFSG